MPVPQLPPPPHDAPRALAAMSASTVPASSTVGLDPDAGNTCHNTSSVRAIQPSTPLSIGASQTVIDVDLGLPSTSFWALQGPLEAPQLEAFAGKCVQGSSEPLQELVPMPNSPQLAVCETLPCIVRDGLGRLHMGVGTGTHRIVVPRLEAALLTSQGECSPPDARVNRLLGRAAMPRGQMVECCQPW